MNMLYVLFYHCRLLDEKYTSDDSFVDFCNLRRGSSAYSLDTLLHLPVSPNTSVMLQGLPQDPSTPPPPLKNHCLTSWCQVYLRFESCILRISAGNGCKLAIFKENYELNKLMIFIPVDKFSFVLNYCALLYLEHCGGNFETQTFRVNWNTIFLINVLGQLQISVPVVKQFRWS